MKKAFLTLLAFLIIISLIYTVLWFYQAKKIEDTVRQGIEAYSNNLDMALPGSKVAYKKLVVSGFPSSVNIELTQPELILKMPESEMALQIEDKVSLAVELAQSKIVLQTFGNISSHSENKQAKRALQINYKENPKLEIVADNPTQLFRFLWNVASKTGPTRPYNLDFRSLKYSDKGTEVLDKESGEIVSSSEGININLNNRGDVNNLDFDLEIAFTGNKKNAVYYINALKNGQANKEFVDILNQFGKTSLLANITVKAEYGEDNVGTSEIAFKEFKFTSDFFGIDAQGKISYSQGGIPSGKVILNISNYRNLIKLLSVLYNNHLSGLIERLPPEYKKQVKLLSEKDMERIGELFARAADKISDDTQSIAITIHGEGAGLYVGKLTQEQIATELQNIIAVNPVKVTKAP